MKKMYRFRVYPNAYQREELAKTFGACRFVYNWALRMRSDAWFENKRSIGYHETALKLTELKHRPGMEWLDSISIVPLQQSLRNLHRAFLNFWNPKDSAKYPAFKKKRGKQSVAYMRNGFSYLNGKLTIAKHKSPIKMRVSRALPSADPSAVIVSLDCSGRYFVSLRFDTIAQPLPRIEAQIGLDLGLNYFVAMSSGEKVLSPKHYQKLEKKIARTQRAMSRRVIGSNNREKARLIHAKVHAKVIDRRKDFLHKLSTRIIRENQVVCAESLVILNLMRNRSLAKHIGAQGWGEFLNQLEYKANWYGRTFYKIGRFYPSSKRCSGCGYVIDGLTLKHRRWECPECGAKHDRDVNAAKNVLAAGLAEMVTVGHTGSDACGDLASDR